MISVISKRYKIAFGLLTLAAVFGLGLWASQAHGEQVGSTPESGSTSYIKQLYTTLQTSGYGTDTDTPSWGTYWNRIKTSAQWVPSGNVTAADVVSGKTFYNSSRTQQTGTNTAAGWTPSGNATAADVVVGKTFYGNSRTQQTGTQPIPGVCPTQAYHDSHGSATQVNNCTNNLTWTVPSGSIAGTEKQDPRTGLIWSNAIVNTAGTATFSPTTNTTFSWDASHANNIAVGNKTAITLCSAMGNGWRLPTQKELMQAYIDGSYFNLSQPGNSFWSATESSSTGAWSVPLTSGSTNNNTKVSAYLVRCVR